MPTNLFIPASLCSNATQLGWVDRLQEGMAKNGASPSGAVIDGLHGDP